MPFDIYGHTVLWPDPINRMLLLKIVNNQIYVKLKRYLCQASLRQSKNESC